MSKKVVIEFELENDGISVDTNTFIMIIDGEPVPCVQRLVLSAEVNKRYGSLDIEQLIY